MSQRLINLNSDLKKLRDEGYDISVQSTFLVMCQIPYVNDARQIKYGKLVSDLTLEGDRTSTPSTHMVYFVGDFPCDQHGIRISQIAHQSSEIKLDDNIVVQHSFSSKPPEGYTDYYDKMVTYSTILSGPARSLDPNVTAQVFPAIETQDEDSVFCYVDTASSRAKINTASRKLEIGSIGIVGVGGTGSYVLDLVAKTPVKEIHLFDGDKFSQHNAFRSPGAPSVEELKLAQQKVIYFQKQYLKIHRNIIAHDGFIDISSVNKLQEMEFVFLCLDHGDTKLLIVEKLEEWNIPFIDVGMGVELVDEALIGVLRVTTSTIEKRDHIRNKNRIQFSDQVGGDEYDHNIQIADLNALNGALAVIKWKKLMGFYLDLEHEHYSTFTIDGNSLINEDCT